MMEIGAVILAGGNSSRMGMDKAGLSLNGTTFLERIIGQLDSVKELLLSVAVSGDDNHPRVREIVDRYPGMGPLGGLCSALEVCQSPYLLALSCDIPLFQWELAEFLATYLNPGVGIVAAVTRDNKTHPLCAIYAKSILPTLLGQLKAGTRRMMSVLEAVGWEPAYLRHTVYPDHFLCNVNTPADLVSLRRHYHKTPILAVSGLNNSGKTTLLEGILPLLFRQGLHVAVIKHDGHEFEADIPGTDSYRLYQAGAMGAGVYSSHRFLLRRRREDSTAEEIAHFFNDTDLILLEGGKDTSYPKLEIVRQGVSLSPVCNTDTLFDLCTDTVLHIEGVPTYSLFDYSAIAEHIINYMQITIN